MQAGDLARAKAKWRETLAGGEAGRNVDARGRVGIFLSLLTSVGTTVGLGPGREG